MLKKTILISVLVGALGMGLIMYFTTPATVHPIVLVVFFLCLYAVVLGVVAMLLYVVQQIYLRIRPHHRSRTDIDRGVYEYATIIALGPVILIALQTVGQLQITDVLFTAMFVAIGCFYVAKRRE